MALIDKETIRKEIDRRIENCVKNVNHRPCHRIEELCELLNFLDTLPEQPVEGLEEEIARYLREECSSDDEPSVSEIARHFAEWGASHLKR